jgi:methylglutaconyl-CoA hydratase
VLTVDRDPRGVVTLTFDRPEARNAFDAALMEALTTTMRELGEDPDVRVVVLTGSGRVFSAGADLGWMGAMAGYSFEQNVADSRGFEAMLRTVHDAPDAGGRPGQRPRARRGGRAARLRRHRGRRAQRAVRLHRGTPRARPGDDLRLRPAADRLAAARRYFLTGERFDAVRAQQLGLVHEVCDDDALDAPSPICSTSCCSAARRPSVPSSR